jgi:hypothetical protein
VQTPETEAQVGKSWTNIGWRKYRPRRRGTGAISGLST